MQKDTGKIVLFFFQTSKEQTQEASDCVPVFWVPLHFVTPSCFSLQILCAFWFPATVISDVGSGW